ncbi:Dipeptidyl peptidase 8 [Taenia crassiceps]|uniref:Dipeptidyl peptidase 8 n=1 Tax=Taenia crassiceps TaxID=6207 RepID=A0ABR4Q7J9_9CEST
MSRWITKIICLARHCGKAFEPNVTEARLSLLPFANCVMEGREVVLEKTFDGLGVVAGAIIHLSSYWRSPRTRAAVERWMSHCDLSLEACVDPTVIWRRVSFDGLVTETINDGLMSRDMSRWKIGQGKQTNSIRLEILVVDETYAGHYTCDCQYTGSVEPARAERILNVVSQAKVLPFHSSYTTTVTEGDRMILRCQAAGIPQPIVYWSRTGGSSSLIRNYGISKPGETIDFLSVLPEDAGEYMCTVENRLGIDYWPVRVVIRHKPKIEIYVTAPIPQSPCNVHLYCEVLANPASEAAEITWSVGSTSTKTVVSTDRRRLVYLNGGNTRFLVVAFNPITAADLDQKYTCLATNILGTVSREYVLNASAWITEGTFADLKCSGTAQMAAEVETRDFAVFFKTAQLVNTPNDWVASQPYFINLRPPQNSPECRVYFASFQPPNGNMIIFYVDVDVSGTASLQDNLVLQPLLQKDAFRSVASRSKVSLAESLLRERMRSSHFSISDIKLDPHSGTFLISIAGKVVQFTDHNWPLPSPCSDTSLNVLSAGESAMQPILCPCNPNLIAYVDGSNIGITNALTSMYTCITNIKDPKISAGRPSFVVQEEFDRYIGLWWRPVLDSRGTYCLMYEEIDERQVEVITLPNFSAWNEQVESHAYPKPGMKNATSTLKMVTFRLDPESYELTDIKIHEWVFPLFQMLPEYEYLVRCDWTEGGKYFWMVLSNRLQTKMSLFLVSPRSFYSGQWTPFILLCDEEDPVYWVEPHDCLRFLEANSTSIRYIWLSRRSGYAHLYEHVRSLAPSPQSASSKIIISTPSPRCFVPTEVVKERQLTGGDWEVLSSHIFVDDVNNLLLFESLREHPLWTNVYAVSYGLVEPRIQRLTLESDWLAISAVANNQLAEAEFQLSFSLLTFDASSGLCVMEASSSKLLPGQALFRLHVDSDGIPRLKALAVLKKLVPIDGVLPAGLNPPCGPQVLSLTFKNIATSRTALTFHGMLFTPPPDTRPPHGFPTLHFVYGGPGVQLVRGICLRNLILRAQIYCHFGYALLVCDCRGSANRGSQFAGHIKYQMGTVELPDHVMFLREAASQTGLIDLNRVAIYGSSYGGYLALMAAAKHRDAYRASIAVCPVVSWQHYDTAYTERYLGLPSEHESAYMNGDVLTYALYFPDKSPYLLIAHGGQDENVHFAHTASLLHRLNALGKPYHLCFYPESRHRIRDEDHLIATVLNFLDQTLRAPP